MCWRQILAGLGRQPNWLMGRNGPSESESFAGWYIGPCISPSRLRVSGGPLDHVSVIEIDLSV